MLEQPIRVTIVGATGLVGRELLGILEQRNWPLSELRAFASRRVTSPRVAFRGDMLAIDPSDDLTTNESDVVFLCTPADVSRALVPAVRAPGRLIVDCSSAFRKDVDVPLVVPEINGGVLVDHPATLIANPNCSTIIALMAVAPLHRAFGVERMVVSTYQAVSGGGAAMLALLERQTRDCHDGITVHHADDEFALLHNIFCHESAVDDEGMNGEERKMIDESRRLLDAPDLRIHATCVRVPVRRAHSEAITLTLRDQASLGDVRDVLDRAAGVRMVDDRTRGIYPEPRHATGEDDVLIGRLRADTSQPAGVGVSLFVSGDQLRKGAALNAVQIAERAWPTMAGAATHASRSASAAR